MILIQTVTMMRAFTLGGALAAALVLTACAPVDDITGSRLAQPPPGGVPRQPVDAGDIAIVGQEVAHSIMDLPAVADATTPPLVQFMGVTSIISGPVPVDTEPYTDLLRDRLLLLTREKLRFIEHTLPPLVIASKKSKSKKPAAAPVPASTDPDYQIMAELRGRYDDDFYRIQVQFVDAHTGDVLFDGLYRIRKEGASESSDESPATPPPAQDPAAQSMDTGIPGVQ